MRLFEEGSGLTVVYSGGSCLPASTAALLVSAPRGTGTPKAPEGS